MTRNEGMRRRCVGERSDSVPAVSGYFQRLAFGAVFYFARNVRTAPDEVTSTTATGAGWQQGGVAFTTTHWSVVLEAQGESPAAQEALEKLCRMYWRPIFAFLRRQGIPTQQAEDITRGFFAELLERRS